MTVSDYVKDFVASRKDARAVMGSRLVSDASQVRRLDVQVERFRKIVREDAQVGQIDDLKAHARAFEAEVHEELAQVFEESKADIAMLMRVMRALVAYREELSRVADDASLLKEVRDELNYADAVHEEALGKLHTLELLLKKLK